MIYVISKATFGDYEVRDIQCNANWCSCPYSDYALIPENMVEGILATKGYCDIVLTDDGSTVASFVAREIPSVPSECCGVNTVLSVNGVKANTNGELTLSHSNVGAAPAGYGLGTGGVWPPEDDLNNAVGSGWYIFTTGITTIPYAGYGVVEVIANNNNGTILQRAHDLIHSYSGYYNYGVSLERVFRDAAWQPWEYINPPMEFGMEYRTTERWNGNAVYTAAINVGSLATGESPIETQITATAIVRFSGFTSNGTIPYIPESARQDKYMRYLGANIVSGKIQLTSIIGTMNTTARQTYCQVWYTKD